VRWVGGLRIWFNLWHGQTFLFPKASRLALGLTQTPIQWVLVALSLQGKQLHRTVLHSHICLFGMVLHFIIFADTKNMQNLTLYTVWQKSLQIKVLNYDQCIFIIWKIYSNQIKNNNIFNKCLSYTRVCSSVWYTESVTFEAFTFQTCNITCDHKSDPNQKFLNVLIYQYSTSHS